MHMRIQSIYLVLEINETLKVHTTFCSYGWSKWSIQQSEAAKFTQLRTHRFDPTKIDFCFIVS